MSKFSPVYERGDKIENSRTDDRYVIIDIDYDKKLCDIVYKVQHYRTKFDMFKIPETIIHKHEETGVYNVKKG